MSSHRGKKTKSARFYTCWLFLYLISRHFLTRESDQRVSLNVGSGQPSWYYVTFRDRKVTKRSRSMSARSSDYISVQTITIGSRLWAPTAARAYFIALRSFIKALHHVTSTSFGYRVNGAVNNRTRLGDGIFEKYNCINTNWFEFQIQVLS